MICIIDKDASTLKSWGFDFPMYFETEDEFFEFLKENASGLDESAQFAVINWDTQNTHIVEVEKEVKLSFTLI